MEMYEIKNSTLREESIMLLSQAAHSPFPVTA